MQCVAHTCPGYSKCPRATPECYDMALAHAVTSAPVKKKRRVMVPVDIRAYKAVWIEE